MWLQTPDGFFSAVQHRTNRNLLVVRTRVKADADHLTDWYADWRRDAVANGGRGFPKAKVTTYAFSDYPWRVIMPRATWAEYVSNAALDLDYGNFKDAVKERQGADRAAVYSKVWATLLTLEDTDSDRREPLWEYPEDMGDSCAHGVSWADPCREC